MVLRTHAPFFDVSQKAAGTNSDYRLWIDVRFRGVLASPPPAATTRRVIESDGVGSPSWFDFTLDKKAELFTEK
jgi:hypothetical protein